MKEVMKEAMGLVIFCSVCFGIMIYAFYSYCGSPF